MAADSTALFRTQRSKLIDLYKKTNTPFDATTFPYTSTRPLVWNILAPQPASPNSTMAHAVARAGQQLVFFSYGSGNGITDGFGGQYNATNSDTNQTSANETNGGQDYVIEGISATCRSRRIQWPAGTCAAAPVPITDPDIIAAYEGNVAGNSQPLPVPIGDPAGLMSPLQLDNPLNLSDMLFAKVAPLLSLQFQFDRERLFVIGNLDQIPEGGAAPLLFANGEARTDNRYRIPEGFLWRAAGQTDSIFQAIVTLTQPVVVPIQLGQLFDSAPQSETNLPIPLRFALDIKMRVHGLSVKMPSQN